VDKLAGLIALARHEIPRAEEEFRTAVAHANLGAPDKARPFAERAASHPKLADLAKALLDRIQ